MNEHTTQNPTEEIPYGYCQCGCGQKTAIPSKTHRKMGRIKGQPMRFVHGHNGRKELLQGSYPLPDDPNPSGLCMCGCGQVTAIALYNQLGKGWVAGKHVRYIPGHNIAPYRDTLEGAFWAYVSPGEPDQCWVWQGPTDKGYGVLKWQGKKYFAHRVSYELHKGPISNGLDVCHRCDNPPCCNPAHLWPGTHTENMADMNAKGRHADFSGQKNPFAKLSDSDILEIRQLRKTGMSYASIGIRFGIRATTAHRIAKYKSWKHVP